MARGTRALSLIFHVLLDVTQLLLNLAEVLLNVAFRFQRLIAHEFARGFLDRSFRLFDAALDLVFVDAHEVLLLIYMLIHSDERPAVGCRLHVPAEQQSL